MVCVSLQQTFRDGEIGHPFGMQLSGKTLGIIGMGAIGTQLTPHKIAMQLYAISPVLGLCDMNVCVIMFCNQDEGLAFNGRVKCSEILPVSALYMVAF